jgi:hypothetical protein
MGIHQKLMNVQSELEVPKNQYNSFGKYNFRNCEDILEAAKPLLNKNGLTLVIKDELVLVGDRYYIKSIPTLTDIETNETVTGEGWSREEETKKGMDGSQVTGASSSYARKYALNGLFCIDDVKDSDSTNKNGKNSDKGIDKSTDTTKPTMKCSKCGATINQAVSSFSTKKYGKELCTSCQKKVGA